MLNFINNISNWWSPEQPVCGDVFKQMGFSYDTPEFIKKICCPVEETLGVKGSTAATAALFITGGVFLYYGGPQRIWKKFRKETVLDIIMAAVQIGVTIKYPKIGSLIPAIKLTLDQCLPEVIDHKKQQKRHDILNKLNGISKLKKEAAVANYNKPENQKAMEKTIHEELITDITNYILTYAERFAKSSQEDQQIILSGLRNFLLGHQLPSFKKLQNDHINTLTSSSKPRK